MFYLFLQNNSNGRWFFDRENGVGVRTIIEASSQKKAKEKAGEIGIYFNEYRAGDCVCCGYRWYDVAVDKGKNLSDLMFFRYMVFYTDDSFRADISGITLDSPSSTIKKYMNFLHRKDGTIEQFEWNY